MSLHSAPENVDARSGTELPYRDESELQEYREWGPNVKPYLRTEVNNYGHVVWKQPETARFDNVNFGVQRLLAIAEWGTEAVAGNVVHHKNNIPWDNRVENLELMSREEHGQHHKTGDYRASDEEILLDLRAGHAILGYGPRPSQYDDFGAHTLKTVKRRFGGFQTALREAGIDPDSDEMVPLDDWLQEREEDEC